MLDESTDVQISENSWKYWRFPRWQTLRIQTLLSVYNPAGPVMALQLYQNKMALLMTAFATPGNIRKCEPQPSASQYYLPMAEKCQSLIINLLITSWVQHCWMHLIFLRCWENGRPQARRRSVCRVASNCPGPQMTSKKSYRKVTQILADCYWH